jgi:beta-mannosidase
VPVRGGFKVTVSADKFARAVYLSAPGFVGSFSDNYFDLIPGEKMEVEFRRGPRITLNDFRKQLKVRTMADAF